MVDQLHAEAAGRGVRVERRARVVSVDESADGATVSLADGRIEAGAVIMAAGGPRQLRDLVVDPPVELDRWVAEARPSTVAVLDVGLGSPWGASAPFALGIDRPVYLSVHGPVARLAPPGMTLVSAMRYHHPDERPDPDHDRKELEDLLDTVRPQWRRHAEHVEFRKRLVATHAIPRADLGGFDGRPGATVPGKRRIHLCGDWVGPEGHLTDAVVSSARAAALAGSRALAAAVAA